MKLILLFNSKIENTIDSYFQKNNWGSSPIMYPRLTMDKDDLNKLEILKYTIKSYSKINFFKVIFNLELNTFEEENEIFLFINKYFINCEIEINFKRPCTKEAWIKILKYYNNLYGEDFLCMLAMNHDHPFILESDNLLAKIINDAFDRIRPNDFIIYSHTPEYISKVNLKNNCVNSKYGFIATKMECTESIVIGKFEKIIDLFLQIQVKDVSTYVPRIDWPNLKYLKKSFTIYIPSRELFKHFDGYGHITTIDYYFGLKVKDIDESKNYIELVANLWWNAMSIYIRDNLPLFMKNYFFKTIFSNIYNKTIDIYISTFINKVNYTDEEFKFMVSSAIMTKINTNGSQIIFDSYYHFFSNIVILKPIIKYIKLLKF